MAQKYFNFDFKKEDVRELLNYSKDSDSWYETMCEILPLWDINTVERVAGFIAQCAHESRNFTILSENLNYSASRLDVVFRRHFSGAGRDPNKYHRQPEKIANLVYANRIGNGSVESGDGWKFRGGGLIQLTGRDNYTRFGKVMNMSAEEATNYVRTKRGAIDSACWFWDTNNINRYCDAQDIVGMTRKINGGRNGLSERNQIWLHALDLFDETTASPKVLTVMQIGSRGPTVAELQRKLGIPADGIYGRGTARAVRRFQKINGLTVDGIAGPATLAKL